MPSEKDGVMIILSSPSGAGKTTLVKKLSEKDNFEKSSLDNNRNNRIIKKCKNHKVGDRINNEYRNRNDSLDLRNNNNNFRNDKTKNKDNYYNNNNDNNDRTPRNSKSLSSIINYHFKNIIFLFLIIPESVFS